jgi:hypothetical protein
VFAQYFGDAAELFAGEDLSDGVVGGRDDQHFGPFVERPFELLPIELPFVLRSGLNGILLKAFEQLRLGVLLRTNVTRFLGFS